MAMPSAGQPGHGTEASLRRQPAWLVESRLEAVTPGGLESSAVTAATSPVWILSGAITPGGGSGIVPGVMNSNTEHDYAVVAKAGDWGPAGY
jgi:hypothetical protein